MLSGGPGKKAGGFGTHQIDRYRRIQTVGGGAYGVVYKGYNTETNEVIAVKRIKIEAENEGIPSTAIREISLLREIEHENVVKWLWGRLCRLKDVVTTEQKLYLIFEFVDMDLRQFLEQSDAKAPLDPRLIKVVHVPIV